MLLVLLVLLVLLFVGFVVVLVLLEFVVEFEVVFVVFVPPGGLFPKMQSPLLA